MLGLRRSLIAPLALCALVLFQGGASATEYVFPQVGTTQAHKDSVRAATTVALPANTRTGNVITETANGALPSIDGISLALGDCALLKTEATGANNGIWCVQSLGSAGSQFVLARRSDAFTSAQLLPGTIIPVSEGSTLAGVWQLTTAGPITLNTTSLSFGQLGGGAPTGGAGGDLSGTYPSPSLAASQTHVTSIAPSGVALTLTCGAACTWSSSSGNLTVSSASTLALDATGGVNVGITNSSGVTISRSGQSTIIQSRLDFAQHIHATNVIAPASITGTKDDYAPANGGTATILRQALSGAVSLDGLSISQLSGRLFFWCNTDASLAVTLINEAAGSAAANRILAPGAVSTHTIPAQACALFLYDSSSSRFRIVFVQ